MPQKLSQRKGLRNGRVDDTLEENRLCEYLADWGWSMSAIVSHTQLSSCQIAYRMRLKNQKLANYRNGDSQVAQNVRESFESFYKSKKTKRP
jgi:hypothetical protein